MKVLLRFSFTFAFISLGFLALAADSLAQSESLVGQITSSGANNFTRDISGDGRFVVIESNGDLATQGRQDTLSATGQVIQAGRNNADGNTEIFLFDYAQRRVFQITNTRRLLTDANGSSTTPSNIRVDVLNTQPVISNNGRVIAFISNATSNTPTSTTSGTNPGNYNPNTFTGDQLNNVTTDSNLEIWLYQIPAVAAADLTSGADVPLTDLSAGTFTQATNTLNGLPPIAGSASQTPLIRPDNTAPTISDDGEYTAFVSIRDVVAAVGNADGNREIFVYRRSNNTNHQITQTTPGTFFVSLYSMNPAISGSAFVSATPSENVPLRVAFASTAVNPVRSATTGSNSDNNLEVFYADLDAGGEPIGQTQITRTVGSSPSQGVNFFSPGRRISRNGRFIAFETLSNNPADNGGAIQTGLAVYVYDAATGITNRYKQYGARTFDDAGVVGTVGGCTPPSANGGDSCRYPSFIQAQAVPTAQTSLIFVTRINYRADGTVPATATDGLNSSVTRPVQIYSTPLDTGTAATATVNFRRLTRVPTTTFSDIQPFASNSERRIAFNLANELGGQNSDGNYESFYLISPAVNTDTAANNPLERLRSGASARPVGTPSAIPSPSPSASPSPTPITPDAVPALSRGAVAFADLNYSRVLSSVTAAGASTTTRAFELPIELGGVTVNLNGAAAGIYSVDNLRRRVTFVLPKGLGNGTFNVTVNDNGRISRSTLTIATSQPDVFTSSTAASGDGGRASIFNATNTVLRAEPFNIRTIRTRPYGVTQTRLRLFLTGVRGLLATDFTIRVGGTIIPAANILTGAIESELPGYYTIDFLLPPELFGAGDVPIIVTTSGNSSRLDDTAPRLRIL